MYVFMESDTRVCTRIRDPMLLFQIPKYILANTSLKSLSSLASTSVDSDNGIKRSISVPASLSTSVQRQKAARLSVPSSFGADVGKVLRLESMPSVGITNSAGRFADALAYPVDEPDSRGRTALYAAVYGNHFRMLQLLLMLGADPNRPSVAIGDALA